MINKKKTKDVFKDVFSKPIRVWYACEICGEKEKSDVDITLSQILDYKYITFNIEKCGDIESSSAVIVCKKCYEMIYEKMKIWAKEQRVK